MRQWKLKYAVGRLASPTVFCSYAALMATSRVILRHLTHDSLEQVAAGASFGCWSRRTRWNSPRARSSESPSALRATNYCGICTTASALIDSCEADADLGAETAWLAEIAQRAVRVRVDGPVGILWSTVRAELLAK